VGLREAVESDPSGPGGSCPVAVLISGGVPQGSTTTEPLEPEDREFLTQACTPGSPAVLARIQRQLVTDGYKVGSTALARHRRRDCRCP